MLVRRLRTRSCMSAKAFAAVAQVDEARLVQIESGACQPPVSEVQRIFAAAGEDLLVRVEVYDPHDDVLELQYRREQGHHIDGAPAATPASAAAGSAIGTPLAP